MYVELGWNCDFCGKSTLIMAPSTGIVYCKLCRKSYGESLYEKLRRKQNER